MNNVIKNKALEIIKLQIIIKLDELDCKSTCGKNYNFSKYSLLILIMRDIHAGYLELKNTHDDIKNFANELKNLDEGPKSVKKVFYKQYRIIFCYKSKSS